MEANKTAAPYVSPNGYTSDYGPNVENILCRGSRVIRGRVPAQVRKELNAAVRAGVLGRLKKDGLKPEVYFHPCNKNSAIEIQKREALYGIECIAKVVASPAQVRAGIEAMGGNVVEHVLAEAAALSRTTGA